MYSRSPGRYQAMSVLPVALIVYRSPGLREYIQPRPTGGRPPSSIDDLVDGAKFFAITRHHAEVRGVACTRISNGRASARNTISWVVLAGRCAVPEQTAQ